MRLFKKKESGYIDLEKHLSKREARFQNFKKQMPSEDGTVDLSETPTVQQSTSPTPESSGGGFFGGFFGGGASSDNQSINQSDNTTSESEEKKKRLIKRIMDLTNQVEEQDKELYSLKQRIEVLERKSRIDY